MGKALKGSTLSRRPEPGGHLNPPRLLRHKSVAATLRYHVGADAERASDRCREARQRNEAARDLRSGAAAVSAGPVSEEIQQHLQHCCRKPLRARSSGG
jgi:hypothetical protein